MIIRGKGVYLWNIKDTEGGDPEQIAQVAAEAGLQHVLIKIADRTYPFNVRGGVDLVPPLVIALRKRNISPVAWHYVYGDDPIGEADVGTYRALALGFDGYIIDAEVEYKHKYDRAIKFMTRVNSNLDGRMPTYLSSFRFPDLHPEFPWDEFLSRVTYNMPQIYWLGAHNPVEQLARCVREFGSGSYPIKPLLPTGAAYRDNTIDWQATPEEVTAFMGAALLQDFPAVNFWEMRNTRVFVPGCWDAISDFEYGATPPPPPDDPVYVQCRVAKVRSDIRGLNVRAAPVYPSAHRWFMLPPGELVAVQETKEYPDGSLWLRIGERQWIAMLWNSPFDGVLYQFVYWEKE